MRIAIACDADAPLHELAALADADLVPDARARS